MTMPQQDELSLRGLIEGNYGPLRKFTGIMDSFTTREQTYTTTNADGSQGQGVPRVRAVLNFRELDIVQAVEPYHLPIYVLEVSRSNRKDSGWGVLATSWTNIIDAQFSKDQLDPTNPAYVPPEKRPNIKDCIGKRVGLVLADGQDGRPAAPMLWSGQTRKPEPRPSWMVYSMEGVKTGGSVSPAEYAMQLLDGKTLAEFNNKAITDATIRSDAGLVGAVSRPPSDETSFVNMMLKAGNFTVDANGVHHRVKK